MRFWPKPWHWTEERRWIVVERSCGYRFERKQAKLIKFDKNCSVKWINLDGWGEYTRLIKEDS